MKKNKFSNLKNILIVMLVLTSIYQTSMLWLGSSASHNFFYSFFENNQGFFKNTEEVSNAVIDPEYMVVGYGNKTFSIYYPKAVNDSIYKKTNEYVAQLLLEGEFVETQETTISDYLLRKCVVLDFPVDISAPQYFSAIGNVFAWDWEPTSVISHIILVPSATTAEESYLYIVDNGSGKTTVLKSDNRAVANELYSVIEEYEKNNSGKLRYISTAESGFNIFKNNIFVPQWSQASYEYPILQKEKSLDRYGTNKEIALETATEAFFGNYGAQNINQDSNEVYMLNSEDIVLRYYPFNVLEYYEYTQNHSLQEQTLASAFFACKEFFAKDETLKTQVQLADIQLKNNGLAFYFNYSVNNMPVFLSKEIKAELGMDYAIEVLVENNTVRQYKRYAYDFFADTENVTSANVDFLSAIDRAISGNDAIENITEIESIYLGYEVGVTENSGLKWFITVAGTQYTVEAYEQR